ncbi:unnamed protein product [Mytilus edulis]|uniref:Uncharacterized protein n=1 Tax=Mytilus edulis TaxID=6550 RepID=A0A8S3R2U8_MYTED|nr:unnamed protein product [Mytilus edulis]
MELSKKLRGKKIFSEQDNVNNGQLESDDQVMKEKVGNSPSDYDVSDIDDNMSSTHSSSVTSENYDMEDNMSVNSVKIENNQKSTDIGANDTKLVTKEHVQNLVRALIGKALSFLFGTVSDSDLSKIRRNIKTLAQNQDAIRHIVQDGLTILNTTQTHVSENRHKVNELIESVEELGNRLHTFATDIKIQIEVMGNYL